MRNFAIGLVLAALASLPASGEEYVSFRAKEDGQGKVFQTAPSAINDDGTVTGAYNESGEAVRHGFIRHPDGSFAFFDTPDGTAVPVAINSRGDVTGNTDSLGQVYHGFVRLADGTLTVFKVPGALETFPRAIDASGRIVGTCAIKQDPGGRRSHGFIREPDGTSALVDGPRALNTSLFDINDSGATLGSFSNRNHAVGFLRLADGSFALFSETLFPLSLNNALWTVVARHPGKTFVRDPDGHKALIDIENQRFRKINANNHVAGSYERRHVSFGFLRTGDGALVTFSAPGAGMARGAGTFVTGINDGGVIVGFTANRVHKLNSVVGFLRLP